MPSTAEELAACRGSIVIHENATVRIRGGSISEKTKDLQAFFVAGKVTLDEYQLLKSQLEADETIAEINSSELSRSR